MRQSVWMEIIQMKATEQYLPSEGLELMNEMLCCNRSNRSNRSGLVSVAAVTILC